MNVKVVIPLVAIVVSALVVAAVAWHSVEEIHYLKTFYPGRFTVEEAFYASAVELIKVLIIAIPLLIVMAVALVVIGRSGRL